MAKFYSVMSKIHLYGLQYIKVKKKVAWLQ
jgi:hypothetical protein